MSQASTELEYEFEDEFEDEYEAEEEDEAFLGGLAGIAKSLLGEGEAETEHELEGEYEAEEELEGEFEDEFEAELEGEFEEEYEAEEEDEAFLGGIARSLLGEGEAEAEYEYEHEGELEAEAEFFFKKVGGFLRKHKGLLKRIAKTAAPLIATAVGGPAAGMVARAVTSQLEGELEAELEAELEEMATAPVTSKQALAEYLAAKAATTESESEAEAFAGSAVTITLSDRDRRRLEEMLPHLVRGASVLTRVLHRNPASRPAVRLVPAIADSAARTLVRHAAGGAVRPADVGAVLGQSARRVLSDWRWRNGAARRHARGLAHMLRRHPHVRTRHGRLLYTGRRPGYAAGAARRRVTTIRRRPSQVRAVSSRARVSRPRPGFVRVVTPVRVPARGGAPARTVRVVSDVKVPRGAVPAGRPVGLAGRRR